MTLTELKYIVAVAREKHFGKAAEACHVSQPTLSLAIKKLEEELELKLFERSAGEWAAAPPLRPACCCMARARVADWGTPPASA